jgi:hypothetical protein
MVLSDFPFFFCFLTVKMNLQIILSCTRTGVCRMMLLLDPNQLITALMQLDGGKLQRMSSC